MGVGDELMCTGDVATVFEQSGKKVVVLDRKGKPRWHEIFRGNPKILTPQEFHNGKEGTYPVVHSGPGSRPYADYVAIEALGKRVDPAATERKKLRRAASRLCFNLAYRVRGGEIYFDENEKRFGEDATKKLGPFVIIEPNIKGRTPAKQWGVENWQALADEMIRQGKQPIQIGPGGGIQLRGVRYVKTPTFRQGMAVMEHAETFVVPEGGMHHAFGALHKKGVALFAGRTPLTLSYPEQLTWYIPDQHAPCGMEHVDCKHCRRLWRALSVTKVYAMLTATCD